MKEVKFRVSDAQTRKKLLQIIPEWMSVLELVGKDTKKNLLQPNVTMNIYVRRCFKVKASMCKMKITQNGVKD